MGKFDKKTLIYSAGAGVGVIQTVISKGWGICPIIGGYFPAPWNDASAIGNILLGAIVTGVSQYTKLFSKHAYMKDFFTLYGMTILIGGFVNGISSITSPLFYGSGGMNSNTSGTNGYYTPTYYPGFQGNFYRRPESRARGFGSDVTRNPMAAIPTTIPYNTIIY